jgi:uncharacterized protein with PIN domain
MVIDSSALIAIITGAPERGGLIQTITASSISLVSAPTMMETSLVGFEPPG